MTPHAWLAPATLAARLGGTRHGATWRAPCPVHGGDNPTALSLREGTDKYGAPCTLLYCFAHACPVDALCAALGITVAQLFVTAPAYAQATAAQPRARSPRLDALRTQTTPAAPDDIAEILLWEMLVSDPVFFDECAGARETCWRLGQDPARRARLTAALREAHRPTQATWQTLRAAWGDQDGS